MSVLNWAELCEDAEDAKISRQKTKWVLVMNRLYIQIKKTDRSS
tara:strand:+ start:160 stop:291 length:132 start_codon:yes stop_codon:yes gene_type:complete